MHHKWVKHSLFSFFLISLSFGFHFQPRIYVTVLLSAPAKCVLVWSQSVSAADGLSRKAAEQSFPSVRFDQFLNWFMNPREKIQRKIVNSSQLNRVVDQIACF